MRQFAALVGTAVRELTHGMPLVTRELRGWRKRALTIPDGPLRADALHSLTRKRANTDGAALFSTLARGRWPALVAVIAAYETIWDFLDNVSERGASVGAENGQLLHAALLDALDLDTAVSCYYEHNPCKQDGGYLAGLVARCRECCARLPSYQRVRRMLTQEARRSDVGVHNHELDPARRAAALRHWAEREFPSWTGAARRDGALAVEAQTVLAPTVGAPTVGAPTVGAPTVGAPTVGAPAVGAPTGAVATAGAASPAAQVPAVRESLATERTGRDAPAWFELTAAASCSAVVHVLLVLAATPTYDEHEVASVYAAYFPWFSIAVTMLDSYVDRAEDAASGAHSYVSYYRDEEVVLRRLCCAVEQTMGALRSLRLGRCHAVIAACMVSMYLSKDSARSPQERAATASIVDAGGSLTRLLLPILRIWRIAYGQQSA